MIPPEGFSPSLPHQAHPTVKPPWPPMNQCWSLPCENLLSPPRPRDLPDISLLTPSFDLIYSLMIPVRLSFDTCLGSYRFRIGSRLIPIRKLNEFIMFPAPWAWAPESKRIYIKVEITYRTIKSNINKYILYINAYINQPVRVSRIFIKRRVLNPSLSKISRRGFVIRFPRIRRKTPGGGFGTKGSLCMKPPCCTIRQGRL